MGTCFVGSWLESRAGAGTLSGMNTPFSRRSFLGLAAAGAAGLSLPAAAAEAVATGFTGIYRIGVSTYSFWRLRRALWLESARTSSWETLLKSSMDWVT